MKLTLAIVVALFLYQVPARAQVMIAPQLDLTFFPAPTVDFGGHLVLKTPIYLGFDAAIATSILGGTFDYADGDLSIDALPLGKDITLAPRLGLSSVIVGDRHAFSGVNYGVAIRGRARNGDVIRVDVIYRRVAGQVLYTLALGGEVKP